MIKRASDSRMCTNTSEILNIVISIENRAEVRDSGWKEYIEPSLYVPVRFLFQECLGSINSHNRTDSVIEMDTS